MKPWRILNWLRSTKQEEIQLQQENTHPIFTIELLTDGKIFIKTQWPYPDNTEQAFETARNMAVVIFMLNTGELLTIFQQALSINGERTNTQGVAGKTLEFLNNTIKSKAMEQVDLVVQPTEVFGDNKN